MIEALSELFMR